MKLKLDENLGRHTAEVLRAVGHDVSTVPEEALTSASDQAVIEASCAGGRCLVTLDLGFGNPLLFDPRRFRGIAVIRPLRDRPRMSSTRRVLSRQRLVPVVRGQRQRPPSAGLGEPSSYFVLR